MKKWISLLLALVMVLTPVTASANGDTQGNTAGGAALKPADGDLRHDVYGDVSEFEVSEELDKADTEGKEATVGTDLYLFVDPDTASYITFYVTDEEGNPIEGALIFISYKNDMELYGSTNHLGVFQTYLFRDVEYGYKVYRSGYEPAEGSFTATKETELVRVVLRKYYKLDVIVTDNGVPVPGIRLSIEGEEYTTDINGTVRKYVTNGVYDIEVYTPDGRVIPAKAVVNGDTVVIIEIGLDQEGIIPGGRYQDRFLVFNKYYEPEDYVLTKYLFEETDVAENLSGAYLDCTTDTVLIEAQAEHIQHAEAPDTDVLDENGEALYAQRSLMPSGFVIRAWENEGFEKLVFTNEEMALSFDLATLHGEKMMKLYGLIHYLSNEKVRLNDIATEKCLNTTLGFEKAGFDRISPWNVELRYVDLDAVRDFAFSFDAENAPGVQPLSDDYFVNSIFEFRITPILPEAMLNMISGGLTGDHSMAKTEIMLASWGYYEEELRRWLCNGYLSEAEHDELYAFMVDGKLSRDEIQTLRQKKADGEFAEAELEFILNAAADKKLYRVSCWLTCRNVTVDITSIVDGLQLIRKADRQYEEVFAGLKAENESLEEAELSAMAEQELQARYDFMLVDYDPARYSMEDYRAGEFTSFEKPQLIRSLDKNGDFFDVLSALSFEQYSVDVRREPAELANATEQFKAYISPGSTVLQTHLAFAVPHQQCSLSALAYTN